MSWREQLQPASFRGVPFQTRSYDTPVGRRNVIHEYPGRDVPYVEDLGRRARRYNLDAYVLGEDFMAQRDRLIRALESAGPGELVHPRYGRLWVALAEAVPVRESMDEGRVARFSLVFVEAGDNPMPTAKPDTRTQVHSAAAATKPLNARDYAQALGVEGLPDAVRTGAFSDALKMLANLQATARRVMNPAELAVVLNQLTQMGTGIGSLMRSPLVFAQNLQAMFDATVNGLRRPGQALRAWQEHLALHPKPLAPTAVPASYGRISVIAARTYANSLATANLARRTTLVALAESVTLVDFDSRDAALLARDVLVTAIDNETDHYPLEIDVLRSYQTLRSAVVRDIAARGEMLERRVMVTPKAVLPALVLAYEIYGDTSRADELVQRNRIAHPLFMPVQPLETLQ